MEDRLKPCPFCGSDRIDVHVYMKLVGCTNCGGSYKGFNDETTEEMIEQWNTRKPIDETIERIHKYFVKQAQKRANGMEEVPMGLVADILEHNKGVCEIIKAGGKDV